LAAPTVPARAQVVGPGQRDVLDGLSPAVPGLTAQVSSSVGEELILANPTPTPVLVLAPSGEPFLQIGRAGVLANLNSPTWYQVNDPTGVSSVPSGLVPSAPPRWVLVTSQSAWGWFDPRLPAGLKTSAPAPSAGATTRIGDWSVPLRYGQEAVTVRGHFEYHLPRGALVPKLLTQLPVAPGVLLAVQPGTVPALFLEVSGTQTVVVLGEAGEPFLRVGPGGVEVNRASPTWSLSAASRGQAPAAIVDAKAPPTWQQLDTSPSIAWLDPRAQYGPGEPPAAVQDLSIPTDVLHWTVPLLVGSRRIDVQGVTTWVPNLAPGSLGLQQATAALHPPRPATHRRGWPLALVVCLGAAVIAGAAVIWRKRLRRG
jgi:hypothetical protein